MNANELADLYDSPYEFPEWGSKAQTMLRQQQAEIEALNEERNRLWKEKLNLAKILTDEEITIVKEAVGNYVFTIKMEIDQEKQTFKGYENCSNLTALRSELKDAEQALAILRKAQEK